MKYEVCARSFGAADEDIANDNKDNNVIIDLISWALSVKIAKNSW